MARAILDQLPHESLHYVGDTANGPYAPVSAGSATQASVGPAVRAAAADARRQLLEAEDDIWELWLTAGKLSLMVDQCISTTEPAYLAKYAFQLAQLFNNFYHRHHILTEEDATRKSLLLATAAVVRRELVKTLSILGIQAPEVM